MVSKLLLASFLAFLLPLVENSESLAKDQNNKKVKRVVALTSLSADLVASLDSSVLVGIPGTSLTENDIRYKGIKRISSGRNQPNLEAIVSLNPDFVIGASGFHSKVLDTLKRLGIKTQSFKIDRWSNLINAAHLLSSKISNNGKLIDKINSLCPESTYLQDKKERINILILAGMSPKLSPSKNSWSGSLLERANLNNVTTNFKGNSQFSGYITMSNERLLTVNPSKVLIVNPSGSHNDQYSSLSKFFPNLMRSDFIAFNYYGLINPGSLQSISGACSKLQKL